MTKNELKELVKQHFNLVEAKNVQNFDSAKLEDGSEVSNQKAGKFALGQILYIKDDKGNFVEAPEGEHISKSGIQFILDKDSKITGLKYPDAKGEGSADLAEEDMDPQDKDLIKKGDVADEGAFASKDDMDARTDAEEEGYLDGIKDEKADAKRKAIEEGGFALEDVVEMIAEVVEAKVEELKKDMMKIDEKMKSMEEKMSSFSSEPAADKTVPAIKFSKAGDDTKEDKRYNMMLKRMSNK